MCVWCDYSSEMYLDDVILQLLRALVFLFTQRARKTRLFCNWRRHSVNTSGKIRGSYFRARSCASPDISWMQIVFRIRLRYKQNFSLRGWVHERLRHASFWSSDCKRGTDLLSVKCFEKSYKSHLRVLTCHHPMRMLMSLQIFLRTESFWAIGKDTNALELEGMASFMSLHVRLLDERLPASWAFKRTLTYEMLEVNWLMSFELLPYLCGASCDA